MGWLLDHPDIQVTEVSDADTVSDEYSDEEVLEELEEAEPTFPVVRFFPLFIPSITTIIIIRVREPLVCQVVLMICLMRALCVVSLPVRW